MTWKHKIIKRLTAVGLVAVLSNLTFMTAYAYDDPIVIENENATLGDILVNDDDNAALSVEVDSASSNVTAGNLTNIGDDYALHVTAQNGGNAQVSVTGDVESGQIGAYVASQSGTTEVNINGDVTGGILGLTVETTGGQNRVEIDGNILSQQGGMLVGAQNGGSNTVLVSGDVAGQEGIVFFAVDGEGASNNIVVEGTVGCTPDGASIAVYDHGAVAPGTITVWKAENNSDGHVAMLASHSTGEAYASPALEASVQYIIKVNQTAGATLHATKENGAALATVRGMTNTWQWAHEGDKVLLKVDLEDDYELIGAYGDAGKSYSLLKDENGDYYIIVPKGGGVSFSVIVSQGHQNRGVDVNGGGSESFSVPVVTDSMTLALINATPPGGTSTLSGLSGKGLSPATVQALLLRRDITVIVTYYLNGVLYQVVIPAGADISALLNEAGGIDFTALSAYFGAEAVIK